MTWKVCAICLHRKQKFIPRCWGGEPRVFFEKMCVLSDVKKSWQKLHNTLVSTEGKPVMIKHFTYHWAIKDGHETTFEVCDVFEFNENNKIVKETIIYDTHQLRIDMDGNPLKI